jgi:multidrug efflux pump
MSLSSPFIRKPVATTLLTIAVALSGIAAFNLLPVSPLPQVDFPTVSVSASLPGASPEIMASSVATPLERQFGRISAVTEMTSSSSLGQTSITLQFDLNRNIDAAARDVQAAINAARSYLPANLPSNPTYRKVNPADSPIMLVALSSDKVPPSGLYDAASTVLMQRISQIPGVGQVVVGGSSAPAVRIDVNPTQLNHYGISLDQVRTAVASQTLNQAKGVFADSKRTWMIGTNDQLLHAADYRSLIVSFRGAPLELNKVGRVTDSVQTVRSLGLSNGKRSALVIIFRQPGANIIKTVDGIKASLPQLHASIDPNITLTTVLDQTVTIRASVQDVEHTLVISVVLVVLVVFVFLRDVRATLIPSVAVPVSLIGTFGVMYLLGYSLDNLSLMALTISTGFVVDDAIVVLENITRYREEGMSAMDAAYKGAAEIGSTVLSISVSLVAVFIPILMMGGIVGRLFREFAVTLSVTILVSLVVSLTTTPMMSSRLLTTVREHGRLYVASEKVFDRILRGYELSLAWVLRHSATMLLVTALTLGFNVYLFVKVPKGFFPQQDTGRINGNFIGDQSISFQAMARKITQMIKIVQSDPGVDTVQAFSGGGGGTTTNTGRAFISLKPLKERNGVTADQIITRLRPKLSGVPGVTLFLQSAQDVRMGGRQSAAQYQYSLQSDKLQDLVRWAPILLHQLQKTPELTDVNSDQQNRGLEANLVIDRKTAARMGVTPQTLDNLLYDAFGEREIARTYTSMNQYFVVMEVDPVFWQNPSGLREVYASSATGAPIPLAAFTHFEPSTAALSVTHSGVFPSVTLSFNLAPGIALGDAVAAISAAESKIGMPTTINTSFTGTAQAFQASLANEPMLIATALATVYIVLGILYESYIHPITILSTLPSAGVGAVVALMITHTELSVIALIGIILLIGIVKKNAIMMIDFALEVERRDGKPPEEAVFQACLLRFRPIMMTTMAALLGGLPLALGTGTGSELRRPLGITIVGGLIFSQAVTLYTTPVIYLYMDRFRLWLDSFGRKLPQSPVEAVGPAS